IFTLPLSQLIPLTSSSTLFPYTTLFRSRMLSGVSRGAGIVITTKSDPVLKHVEFIRLEPTKALAVLVGEHNQVENRIIDLPAGRSEEHTSELQSRENLVCRLLLEKKK